MKIFLFEERGRPEFVVQKIIIIKNKEHFKEILVSSASAATSCSRYPAGKTVLLLNILFQLIAYTFIDYL